MEGVALDKISETWKPVQVSVCISLAFLRLVNLDLPHNRSLH